MLTICKAILTSKAAKKNSPERDLRDEVCRILIQPAVVNTLLRLVGTGDKVIQSLLEAQASWDSGKGVELSRLVNLAMEVLERLLRKAEYKVI